MTTTKTTKNYEEMTDREFVAECLGVPVSAVGQRSTVDRFQLTSEILTDEQMSAALGRYATQCKNRGRKLYNTTKTISANTRPPAGGFGLWKTFEVR